MYLSFLKNLSGMTLLELSAGIVVMSIIAIGMTSGAQAVMQTINQIQLGKI